MRTEKQELDKIVTAALSKIKKSRKNKELSQLFAAQWEQMTRSPYADLMRLTFNFHSIELEHEYKFHESRKWRFDFALVELKIAIEIEGGSWIMGGHNRGGIFQSNCDKYNSAVAMGWRLFRFTGDDVKTGNALGFVYRFLTGSELPANNGHVEKKVKKINPSKTSLEIL